MKPADKFFSKLFLKKKAKRMTDGHK